MANDTGLIGQGGCTPPKASLLEDSGPKAAFEVPEDEGLAVKTAFLVVQHENGEWEAITNPTLKVKPEHSPTVIEMKHGASEVVSDIEASKIAAITAHQLMAMTQMAQQQQQMQSLASKLKI